MIAFGSGMKQICGNNRIKDDIGKRNAVLIAEQLARLDIKSTFRKIALADNIEKDIFCVKIIN